MVDCLPMDWEPLLEAAISARERAYCRYSGFAVGAAVSTESGSVFAGCNIENRTYGLTVCAERVAIAAAVAAGERHITAVAVVTDTRPPSTPCGPCREFMSEFGDADTKVLLANLEGERIERSLSELLPYPFELPGREERA